MRGCANQESERGLSPSLVLGVGRGGGDTEEQVDASEDGVDVTSGRVMGKVSNNVDCFFDIQIFIEM